MAKAKPNRFGQTSFGKEVAADAPPSSGQGREAVNANAAAKRQPSRVGKKLIGGHYNKAVHRQIKMLAAQEDTSMEELVAEGLDMLFHSRQLPTIAKQTTNQEESLRA